MMKKLGLLGAATMAMALGLGGAMRAFDAEIPALGGYSMQVKSVVMRDGLGRRVKPKTHPKHNANRISLSFRERVEATHSDRPDPRHDKYLHAHARRMRAMQRLLAA